MSLLVARAELPGAGSVDVRLAGGVVAEIASRLRPRWDEQVIDAAGGALLPGLHDHHVHLRALAARAASVDLSPEAVRDAAAVRRQLLRAAADLPPGGWLRAVGYHESVAGDLDRWRLDALAPEGVPTRVQHRSGALWILGSAAIAAAGLEACDEPGVERDRDGRVTGRLWRRDDLVRRIVPAAPVPLRPLVARASALGLTGLTDATPQPDADAARALAADLRAAGMRQRLHLMTGCIEAPPPDGTRVTYGPVKQLLDDDRLPAVGELARVVAAAHAAGRPVALHCVTRAQLVVALAALAEAGTTGADRIEHGSVVPPELIDRLRRDRLTVVTQPHFVAERGDDYLREVEPDDLASLYRCRSLLDAGVAVAAGTDAPFGVLDPWAAVAAAVARRARSGRTVGADERVGLDRALRLFLGHHDRPGRPRAVAVGAPADLCLLRMPRRQLADVLPESPVRATIVGGGLVYDAP